MEREDPGPVNVPPSSDVAERLAALAGQRPWWPLVEPTPRWIRVRIGGELVADSRRALLHVQYGPGVLPRSFLPTYYVPVDDIMPAALVDPVQAETGLTVWAVAAAGLRADDAAWMHHRPPPPLGALAGQRPWWPLVEPTPRWIRVRIGEELVSSARSSPLAARTASTSRTAASKE